MMKVPVTLVTVVREESTRFRFRLFKEVSVGLRKWEDMVLPHLASSVPEDSGLANAEVPTLIIGEMPLEFILIAHSPPQYQLLLLRPTMQTAMAGRAKTRHPRDYHADEYQQYTFTCFRHESGLHLLRLTARFLPCHGALRRNLATFRAAGGLLTA